MKNCVILLPYIEKYTDEYIRNELSQADYVICADGGQSLAKRLNIKPDCVIGDFDSSTVKHELDCRYIEYPSEKDLTDGEACLLHAIENECTNVTFLGGIGGRLDHMMGALALLFIGYNNSVIVTLKDMRNSVRLIDSKAEYTVEKDIYKYFSLYPALDEIELEYIKGARYPVSSPTIMPKASTLCISNEISDKSAKLKLSSGLCYLIQSNDAR